MDEYYDPRYDSSQGRWVTYDADAGAVWEPLTVAAPMGQYVGSGDAGGQYQTYTAQERAAVAAQQEAARQAKLQQAAAYVAENPLAISGGQISTRYGDRDISNFNPLVGQGQAVTGGTQTQMVDPLTKAPVYLSNPNDPFSYTYENTGTPALGGTLEQQAAMYRPAQNKGVFGTLGGDLLSAVKDPYFRNFAIAAATMAAAAAMAPAAGAGGAGSASTGATAYPIDFGSTITSGGLGGGTAGAGSTAGGFLGGTGDVLAGAAGSGGGSLGGSTLGSALAKGGELLAGPYGSLIKGGLSLGTLAVANALKPKVDESAGQSGLTAEQLQAMVANMPSMIGQYTNTGMGQNYGGYNPSMSIASLFPSFSMPQTAAPTVGSTNAPVYGAGRFAPLI